MALSDAGAKVSPPWRGLIPRRSNSAAPEPLGRRGAAVARAPDTVTPQICGWPNRSACNHLTYGAPRRGRRGSCVRVPMVQIGPMRVGVRGGLVLVGVGVAERGGEVRVPVAVVAVVVPVPVLVGGPDVVVRVRVPIPDEQDTRTR